MCIMIVSGDLNLLLWFGLGECLEGRRKKVYQDQASGAQDSLSKAGQILGRNDTGQCAAGARCSGTRLGAREKG